MWLITACPKEVFINDGIRQRQSVLFVFLASVCFSTGGFFFKLIPWSALAINGARNLIGSAVIGVYLLVTRHRISVNPRVIVGAMSLIGVTTLFAVANKLTTAANAIVLQFTAPAFVILLMALIYHQKPDRADLLTCISVSQKFILPGDYVLRSDLTDDALSEGWNQLALNDIGLGLPGALFQSGFAIPFVKLAEGGEGHIHVRGVLL